jgi:hypothetical protein
MSPQSRSDLSGNHALRPRQPVPPAPARLRQGEFEKREKPRFFVWLDVLLRASDALEVEPACVFENLLAGARVAGRRRPNARPARPRPGSIW